MGDTGDKKGRQWTDVSHYHAGGGDGLKLRQKLWDDALRTRAPLEIGEYCFIMKPAANYEVGVPHVVVKDAYFAQVLRYYPNLMEVKRFDKGRSVRGRNSVERIPLVDVRKSEDLVLLNINTIPEVSLEELDIDVLQNLIMAYVSLYPEKRAVEAEVFGVAEGDFCLVNAQREDFVGKYDYYIGEVEYVHNNLIYVREFHHNSTMRGMLHVVIRDEVMRGFVEILKLCERPEEDFTKEELKISNFKVNNGRYLAEK